MTTERAEGRERGETGERAKEGGEEGALVEAGLAIKVEEADLEDGATVMVMVEAAGEGEEGVVQ